MHKLKYYFFIAIIYTMICPKMEAQQSISAWDFFTNYLANASEYTLEEKYENEFKYPTYGRYTKIFNIKGKLNYLTQIKSSLYYGEWSSSMDNSLSLDLTTTISPAFLADNTIRWNVPSYTVNKEEEYYRSKTKEVYTSRNPWQFDIYDIILFNTNGNVLTFQYKMRTHNFENINIPCKNRNSTYGLSNNVTSSIFMPEYGILTLKMKPGSLTSLDEFGEWKWTPNRSKIYLYSKGYDARTRGFEMSITKMNGKLTLTIEPNFFKIPNTGSKTEDGKDIYILNFSFGEDYHPIKMINIGNTESPKLAYGSYNRFTSELNTDATSLLNQIRQYKNCVIKVGSGNDVDIFSYVFNLEGLDQLLDYLTE